MLTELPDPTSAGAANNYSILQEFTNDTDKCNVKGGLAAHARAERRSRRYGYRDADIFDKPPLPLPSGGSGNG